MPQLRREVLIWSDPMGTKAVPVPIAGDDIPAQDAEAAAAPAEPSTEKYLGAYPAGTQVTDVVDIGERNSVRCTIAGQRVTTPKWAIEDEQPAPHSECV